MTQLGEMALTTRGETGDSLKKTISDVKYIGIDNLLYAGRKGEVKELSKMYTLVE